MKAVQFKFAPGDHTVVDNIPRPIPKNDEVLVKVAYSALDTAHHPILHKEFEMNFLHKLREPLYLGYHYSGTIEEVGADVVDMKVGTDVFGFLQYDPSQTQGAFAEYITVKYNECAMIPKDVSFEIAAASATESVTALQAIRDKGGLKMDSNILIVGAAGGVGNAAVQIAKSLGAHVTAVCSSKDVKKVEDLGADIVVDRSSEPGYVQRLLNEKVQFDVILDAPNSLPSLATNLLKPKGGVIVHTTITGTLMWNMIKLLFTSKNATMVMCKSNATDLDFVGKLLSNGNLEIPIDSNFKVCNMSAAMKKQEGRKNGRVAIQVKDGWN